MSGLEELSVLLLLLLSPRLRLCASWNRVMGVVGAVRYRCPPLVGEGLSLRCALRADNRLRIYCTASEGAFLVCAERLLNRDALELLRDGVVGVPSLGASSSICPFSLSVMLNPSP